MLAMMFITKKKFAPALIGAFVAFSYGVALAGKPVAPTPQMRTYVSGKGNDNNPCNVSQPCQTLKAALALTLAGGEIFVLDSANYGAVTISQAVSITAAGAGAGILVTSGTAVVVSAGASDVVNLRGLVLDGGQTGSTGIQFNSGAGLVVQNAIVRNFAANGINFAPTGEAQFIHHRYDGQRQYQQRNFNRPSRFKRGERHDRPTLGIWKWGRHSGQRRKCQPRHDRHRCRQQHLRRRRDVVIGDSHGAQLDVQQQHGWCVGRPIGAGSCRPIGADIQRHRLELAEQCSAAKLRRQQSQW